MGDRKNKKAIQQSALAEDIWGAETTQDVSAASIPETSIAADIWDEETTSSPLASADTDIPKPEPSATTQEYTNKLFGKDVQGRPIVPATPPNPAQSTKVDPQERLKKATETIASDYISMRGAPEGIDINNPENPLNQVTNPTADPAYIGSYIQGRMSDIDADYSRRQHEIKTREMSGAPVFGERQQAKTEYEAKKKDLFENAGHIVSLQLFNKEYRQQKPSAIHSDIAMDARLKEHQSEIQDIDDQIRATKTWAHPNGIEAVQERKSLERKKELLQERLQSDAAKIKQGQKFNPILLGAEYHAAFGDKNASRDIDLIRQGKPVNPARQYAYNQIGNTIIEEGTAASVNENAISEGAANIDVGGERLFENNKPFILEQARMAVANKKYQKENALLHAIVPSAMLPDISKEEIKAIGEEAGLSEKVIKEIQADPALIPKSTSLMQQFARGALNTAAPIYEQGIRALARLSPDGDMEFVEEHFQPGWESQRGLGAAIAGNNPTEQNSFRNFRGAVGQIMEGAGGLATFAGEVGIVGKFLANKKLAKLGTTATQADRLAATTQADKLANFSVMAFNGYNDAYHTSKEVIGEDPKDEGKRQLYSLINGIAAGAIFSISPQAELVKKALGMETKSGKKLLEEIQKSKGIEFLSTKQGKATITDYVREFLKENGKQVGLATTVKIAEQITNAIANPEMKQDVAEDIKNTAISTALAMFLPSIGGAFGHVRGKTPLNSAAAFEIGTHPEEYISHVSDLLAEGKISPADAQVSHEAILNMKKAISATPTKNADGKDLSPNQIKDYAYSLLQESIIQKQADKITESAKALNITPDKAQVDPLKERISALQQERLQIMEKPQAPTVEVAEEVAVDTEGDVVGAEVVTEENKGEKSTFEEDMRSSDTMYEFYENRLKDEASEDWQREHAKEYLDDPISFLQKNIEAAKKNLERDPEDKISQEVLSVSEKELELVRKIVEKHQSEKPERSVATDGQSEEIAPTEKKSPEKVAEIEKEDIPLTSTETPATEVATENVIVEPQKIQEDGSIKENVRREDGSEIGETGRSQESTEIRQAADSEGRIQPEETGQLKQGKKPRKRIKLEPEQPEVVAQAIPFVEPPKVEKDATEISKGKEQVSDKQSGEAERPRTESPAGKEAAPQAGGGDSVKRGKGKSKEKVEEPVAATPAPPTKPKRKGKVWNPDVYMKRRKAALENEASSIEEHLLRVMLGMDDKNPTGKWRYSDVEKELPSRSVVGNKGGDGDPFAPRREVIPEEKRIAKQFTHKDGKSIDKWAADLAREIEDGHHPFGLDGMDSKDIGDLIKSMVSRFPSKHALLEHLENLREGRKEKDPSDLSEADYIASRQLIEERERMQKEWEDEDAAKIEEQIHQEISETKDKLSDEDVTILDEYLQGFVKDGIYDDTGMDVFSDEFQTAFHSLPPEGRKIFNTITEGGSGKNTELVKEIISKADVNRKKYEADNEQEPTSSEADSGDAAKGQGGDTTTRDGDKPDVKPPIGEAEAGGEAKRELIKSISDKLRQAAKKAPDAIRKIAKSMGISANWDMAGEGDFLSGKSGEFRYTQRRLGHWNRQSQLGEINPKSEITYKSNDDKKTPYIAAVDENGVQIGELATSRSNDGVVSIEHLVVAPEFRGKGVAEELYNKAKEINPDIDLSAAKMQSEGYAKFVAPIAIAERYAREKESGIDSDFTKAVESAIKVEKEEPATILSRKQKRHEELSLELDELKGDKENLEAQLESAYATSTPDAEFIDRVEQAIKEVSAEIEAKDRQVKLKQKEIDRLKAVVKNANAIRKQAKKIEDSSRGMIGSMPGVSPKIAAEILRKVADLYEGLGNVYVAAIRAAEWAKQQFKGEKGIGALSDVHVRELLSAYTEPQKAEPIIKNKQHLESAQEAIEDIINGEATLEQIIEEVMDNPDVSDKTKANILNYIDWHIQGRDYHNDISLREKQYEDSYYDEYAMSGTGRETNYLSEQTLKDVTGQDVLARETAEALSIENVSRDAANLAGLAKNKYGDDIMQWAPSMLEDIRKSKSDDPVKKVAALTGLAWELRAEKQRNPSRELQVDKVLYQVEREWKETLRSASKTLNAARANRLFRNEHYADMYAEQIMNDAQREGKRTYEDALSDQKRMDEVSEKYEKEGVLRNEAEVAKEEAIKAEKAKKREEAKAEKEKEGKKSPIEKIRDVFRKSKKDKREAKPKEYYKEQAEKTAKEMGKSPDKFMEELKAKIKSIKC